MKLYVVLQVGDIAIREPEDALDASFFLTAGDPIQVAGERLDDGWLMVAVEPTQPTTIRASEYANLMSAIERELRQTGFDEVLLVPALVE
jgi:hypothetical protein